jgi:transposase
VPSTYASGGKVFHGRITKTGNKWLRWTLIEAVQPAISCDADLFAYYERLKERKDANAAKVATARRLLTIVYCVLSQERLYQRNRRIKK